MHSLTPQSRFYTTGGRYGQQFEPVYPLSAISDPYTLQAQKRLVLKNLYSVQLDIANQPSSELKVDKRQRENSIEKRLLAREEQSLFKNEDYKRLGQIFYDYTKTTGQLQEQMQAILSQNYNLHNDVKDILYGGKEALQQPQGELPEEEQKDNAI